MRLSRYFLPLEYNSSPIKNILYTLMRQSVNLHQVDAALDSFILLPLGSLVIEKIVRLVQAELNRIDSYQVNVRIFFQTYNQSYEQYALDELQNYIQNYQDLPLKLYQIQWELKNKEADNLHHGHEIGQQHLICKAYSFDLNAEAAKQNYQSIFQAYYRIFRRIGITVIPLCSESDLKHQFYALADIGVSKIFYDSSYRTIDQKDWASLKSLYAADAATYSPNTCPVSEDQLMVSGGIQVGHIVYNGTRSYKETHRQFTNQDGHSFCPEVGVYTLDITELLTAIVAVHHDDKGVIWPDVIAPFQVMIIDLIRSDNATSAIGDQLHAALQNEGIEVLYDDTEDQEKSKFIRADLLGIPYQIIISKQSTLSGIVTMKHRRTGQLQEMTTTQVITKFSKDKS